MWPDAGHKNEWRKIADLGQGSFFQVEQAGSAVAIATPYDERLAKLSAELDGTRLYYGDEKDKVKQARKLEATKKLNETASVTAKARRAAFNASKSGEMNLLGERELVDDVTSGQVDLDSIEPEELPAPLQAMSAGEQKALVIAAGEQRADLKRQMKDLADQRAAYLRDKVEEGGAAEGSLDEGIFRAVREQGGGRARIRRNSARLLTSIYGARHLCRAPAMHLVQDRSDEETTTRTRGRSASPRRHLNIGSYLESRGKRRQKVAALRAFVLTLPCLRSSSSSGWRKGSRTQGDDRSGLQEVISHAASKQAVAGPRHCFVGDSRGMAFGEESGSGGCRVEGSRDRRSTVPRDLP